MERTETAGSGSAGSEDDFDVVVFGAGPVGAAVALGLQNQGHRVCVREKRTEAQVIGDAGMLSSVDPFPANRDLPQL